MHVGVHCSLSDGYGHSQTPPLSQLLTPAAAAPAPLTPIAISSEAISNQDLSPLASWAGMAASDLLLGGPGLELQYHWPRADDDPRELSEIAEPRLWTLRADAHYPWLPLVLERSSGQLTRHVAMLLPHGFSPAEGIRFAPGALELWLTHRLYLLDHWALNEGLNCRQGLGQMAAVLGLELDPGFWPCLPASADPQPEAAG